MLMRLENIYIIFQVLQYDKLPIALEDIFLLNSKGEDENV